MRMVQEEFLPDAADILRPDKIVTAVGGSTDIYVTVATGVPCQASPRVLRQLTERIAGGQIESGVRWVIVFALGVDVRLDDRLRIQIVGSDVANEFEVNGLQGPESWPSAFSVEALLVQ